MTNILCTKADGTDPLSLAFEQDKTSDIFDLISLSGDAVDALDCDASGEKRKNPATPVPRGALSLVVLFLEMVNRCQQCRNIPPTHNICTITREQFAFNDWRISRPKEKECRP